MKTYREQLGRRDACLAKAHELGMGIVAMKVLGAGMLGAWSGHIVPEFDKQRLEGLPAAAIHHVLQDPRVHLLNIGMRLTEEIVANNDGNTALHLASFFAYPDVVALLLKHGASVDVKNARKERPLDLVSAEWSAQLEGTYKSIGELVGIELNLARIKETRPRIAKRLRDQQPQAKKD